MSGEDAPRLQVDSSHYFTEVYCDPVVFASYGHQIQEVIRTHPRTVLEIGPGNGVVSHVLRGAGIRVTTLDFDPELQPDVVAAVQDMPFSRPEFDTVLCCEVLEHLPWSDVPDALRSMYAASRRFAVISVPDSTPYYYIEARLPWLGTRRLGIDYLPARRRHVFDGQHYWEIGRATKLSLVKATLEEAGWSLVRTYRARPQNAYHRFFILEKRLP